MKAVFGKAPPSSFVATSLRGLTPATGRRCKAVDIGCGFGRHTVYLAERGYSVTAIDIEPKYIEGVSEYLLSQPTLSVQTHTCDALSVPSSWLGTFELCVVVDFVRFDILSVALDLVRSGGYLVYQSVTNRGGNWELLPAAGQARGVVKDAMDVYKYEEGAAGPQGANSVTVRLFGRKR